MYFSRKAFTLIELLVVIAIIAILAIVVVLTLNPAALLQQSRDANRLSDLATLNSALNLYSADQAGASSFSMGNTSTTYISIPDPLATSTAGDQCQGLGLPPLSNGYIYHCAASSTYRNVNGTGWIPVNFSKITSGSPFASIPVDQINQTSSDLYYTYTTDGTRYAVTAGLESQKYLKQYLTTNPDPSRYALGSNLTLIPQAEGLVGWWPLNEGSGSTATDQSGNGDNGSWVGTMVGSGGTYYTAGKVGSYAGVFDGTSTYVSIPESTSLNNINTNFTISAWINATTIPAGATPLAVGSDQTGIGWGAVLSTQSNAFVGSIVIGGTSYGSSLYSAVANTWYFVALSRNGTTAAFYVNGNVVNSFTVPSGNLRSFGNAPVYIGDRYSYSQYFPGLVDDVRIYNRALSAAEIQAIYNAEH